MKRQIWTMLSITGPAQEDIDLAIELIESVDATRFTLFISGAHVSKVCPAVRALTSCQKVDYRRCTGVWTLVGCTEARTQAEAAILYWKDHKSMPDQPQLPPQWELQRTQLRGSGAMVLGVRTRLVLEMVLVAMAIQTLLMEVSEVPCVVVRVVLNYVGVCYENRANRRVQPIPLGVDLCSTARETRIGPSRPIPVPPMLRCR